MPSTSNCASWPKLIETPRGPIIVNTPVILLTLYKLSFTISITKREPFGAHEIEIAPLHTEDESPIPVTTRVTVSRIPICELVKVVVITYIVPVVASQVIPVILGNGKPVMAPRVTRKVH